MQWKRIGDLPPEDQERAIKLLQKRGALASDLKPRLRDPAVLWCGHPVDRMRKEDPADPNSVEYCAACTQIIVTDSEGRTWRTK